MVFDRLGDELGLGLAHICLKEVASMSGRLAMMATESQLAADHLIRAGRNRLAQMYTSGTLLVMVVGEHPASQGLVQGQRVAATADARVPRLNAWIAVAFYAALLGNIEEERRSREHAEQLEAELRTSDAAATLTGYVGFAALVCGKAAEAAGLLARTCAVRQATGDVAILSTDAAHYAHALLLSGDHDKGRQQVNLALEVGSTDDVLTQVLARSALAWVAAAEGEDRATVRRHMADALAALEPTELVMDRALVHAACAEAAGLLGDGTTARHHRRCAIDLYDAKENVVGAAFQRGFL